jgi:hypothetical protein
MTDTVVVGGLQAERVLTCPLCGGAPQPLYGDLGDRFYATPGRWDLQSCSNCRSAWIDPRPLEAEIPKLYENYFTHDAIQPEDASRGKLRSGVRDAILAAKLDYLAGSRAWGSLLSIAGPLREIVEGSVLYLKSRPGGRLLDVGSGGGEFLVRMREHGWDVEGIEPDAAAADPGASRLRIAHSPATWRACACRSHRSTSSR